jgi:hypothetical protein
VKSTAAVFSWAGYLLFAVGGDDGTVATSSLGLIVAFLVGGVAYLAISAIRGDRVTART